MSVDGFWTDRRVLVTGCTGLLGSWLAQALLDNGASVVGLVRDWVPGAQVVRSGAIERSLVAAKQRRMAWVSTAESLRVWKR